MKGNISELAAPGIIFLAFILLPGGLSARERRGADIVITLKSGHPVEGELIAVRPDSLLLRDAAGAAGSVALDDIESLRIPKRSPILKGGLYGFLAGVPLGAMLGHAAAAGEHDLQQVFPIFGGLILGAAGGLIGLAVGASSHRSQEIHLSGESEVYMSAVLAKLNRQARMPDAVFKPR